MISTGFFDGRVLVQGTAEFLEGLGSLSSYMEYSAHTAKSFSCQDVTLCEAFRQSRALICQNFTLTPLLLVFGWKHLGCDCLR